MSKKNPKFLVPMVGLSATQRKSIGAGKYEPRQRHPDEALPNTISIKELPHYVPPKAHLVRPGADDHMNIKSRGVAC